MITNQENYIGKKDSRGGHKILAKKSILDKKLPQDLHESNTKVKLKLSQFTTRVKQKSRSDYEQKLNSIFQNVGLGITSSAARFPTNSSKMFRNSSSKLKGTTNMLWEKTLDEKRTGTVFELKHSKPIKIEVDELNLLNQDIEEFEKRLENYRNTQKHKDGIIEIYKVNHARFT